MINQIVFSLFTPNKNVWDVPNNQKFDFSQFENNIFSLEIDDEVFELQENSCFRKYMSNIHSDTQTRNIYFGLKFSEFFSSEILKLRLNFRKTRNFDSQTKIWPKFCRIQQERLIHTQNFAFDKKIGNFRQNFVNLRKNRIFRIPQNQTYPLRILKNSSETSLLRRN